jgi:hypothetical protein
MIKRVEIFKVFIAVPSVCAFAGKRRILVAAIISGAKAMMQACGRQQGQGQPQAMLATAVSAVLVAG